MTTPDLLHETTVIGRVEKAIVAALKERLGSDAFIDAFPPDPAKFDFANYKICALVHFTEASYARPTQPAVPSQDRTLAYTVVLILSDLNMVSDAYARIEAVRKAIQWQRFDGAGPAQMISERMVSEENGRWEFHIKMAVPVMAVPGRIAPRPAFAEENT